MSLLGLTQLPCALMFTVTIQRSLCYKFQLIQCKCRVHTQTISHLYKQNIDCRNFQNLGQKIVIKCCSKEYLPLEEASLAMFIIWSALYTEQQSDLAIASTVYSQDRGKLLLVQTCSINLFRFSPQGSWYLKTNLLTLLCQQDSQCGYGNVNFQ